MEQVQVTVNSKTKVYKYRRELKYTHLTHIYSTSDNRHTTINTSGSCRLPVLGTSPLTQEVH